MPKRVDIDVSRSHFPWSENSRRLHRPLPSGLIQIVLAIVLLCVPLTAMAKDSGPKKVLFHEEFDASFRPHDWVFEGGSWKKGIKLVLGGAHRGSASLRFQSEKGRVIGVLPLVQPLQDATLEVWFREKAGIHGELSISLFDDSADSTGSLAGRLDQGVVLSVPCEGSVTRYVVSRGGEAVSSEGPIRTTGWHRLSFEERAGVLTVYVDRDRLWSSTEKMAADALGISVGGHCAGDAFIDDIVQYEGESMASKEQVKPGVKEEPFRPATLLSVYGGIAWLGPDDSELMPDSSGPRAGLYLSYQPFKNVAVGFDLSYLTGGDLSDEYLFGMAVVEAGSRDRRWYGRFGYGIARATLNPDVPFTPLNDDSGSVWSLGAGARYPLGSNTFLGLELNYTDLGIGNDRGATAFSVLLGFSYRFNSSGPKD